MLDKTLLEKLAEEHGFFYADEPGGIFIDNVKLDRAMLDHIFESPLTDVLYKQHSLRLINLNEQDNIFKFCSSIAC